MHCCFFLSFNFTFEFFGEKFSLKGWSHTSKALGIQAQCTYSLHGTIRGRYACHYQTGKLWSFHMNHVNCCLAQSINLDTKLGKLLKIEHEIIDKANIV